MKSVNGMAERFRAMLNGPNIIVLPGCYDVLSSMLSQQAGFEAVFLSGYGVAASMLGHPDIGLTSLSETTQMTTNVVRAVQVPVVSDVDNGYGNEENVARTIYEMEAAGCAAIQLEDQITPKRCGHDEGKRVLPADLYLRKLEVALKCRRTPLCVIARTDSPDMDDAIQRAKSYVAAGADAVIIDGLRSLDAVKRAAAEVPGPKQLNLIYGGKTPVLTAAEAQALGYKILLYSTPSLYMATKKLRTELKRLRESGDLRSIDSESVTFDDFQTWIQQAYIGRQNWK